MSKKRPDQAPEIDFSGLEGVSRKGGKRPGAGRPKGATNALPAGAVAAIKAARLRVPADATPEAAQLAGRALERIIDVMEDRCGMGSFAVLGAARALREEVCGPLKQKVEHTGAEGGPLVVKVVVEADDDAAFLVDVADA